MDSEWIAIGALVVGIATPLGTLMWAIGERARLSRHELHNKMDSMHSALDNFRVETANDMGELRGRLLSIEQRGMRVRNGDTRPPEV